VKSILGIASCMSLLWATAVHADMPVFEVSPGIYRGPAPETASDYQQLSSLGIRTVLDIRPWRRRQREQECACLKSHGICYIHAPVSFRPERDGSAERALRILANSQRHPIYIHCQLGRDRSGLIIGLYRVRYEGWSRQLAYCEMKRFGFRSFFRRLENYFWDHATREAG
jgi:protein tyrosine/serine phosphatase